MEHICKLVSGDIPGEGERGILGIFVWAADGSRKKKKKEREVYLKGGNKKKNTHTIKCPTGLIKKKGYILYLTRALLSRFYFSFLHRIYPDIP